MPRRATMNVPEELPGQKGEKEPMKSIATGPVLPKKGSGGLRAKWPDGWRGPFSPYWPEIPLPLRGTPDRSVADTDPGF